MTFDLYFYTTFCGAECGLIVVGNRVKEKACGDGSSGGTTQLIWFVIEPVNL
ncbi:MAG: hypothetical protein F6K17_34785 [Okeania sp. SIO3C4]|nr:hypothetical protein [Okeania sp. SIO3C4]